MSNFWGPTQTSLGAVIKRPKLTEDILKKPPFRFLHDVVNEVIKATGFGAGLFNAEELASANISTKETKITFLNKIIELTQIIGGAPVAAKPSKIVAGLEPELTNQFLQTLGKVASSGRDSSAAVRATLQKYGSAVGEPPVLDQAAPSPSVAQPASSSSSSSQQQQQQPPSSPPVVPSINTSRLREDEQATAVAAAVAERDAVRERAQSASRRPPDSARRSSSRRAEEAEAEQQAAMEAEQQQQREQRDQQKRIAASRRQQMEEEEAEAAAQQQQMLMYQQQQQQQAEAMAAATAAQEESEAAAAALVQQQQRMQQTARAERPMSARRPPPKLPSNLRPAEAAPAVPAPSPAIAAAVSASANPRIGSAGSRIGSAGSQRIGSAGSSSSSNDAAPSVPIVKPAGVILDKEDDAQDDDDMIIESGAADIGMPQLPKPSASGADGHGKLVRDLLEEKNRVDASMGNNNNGRRGQQEKSEPEVSATGGIILRRGGDRKGSAKDRESVLGEVSKLRDSIQLVCQSTNPLGKVMEFVQEDLESMGREMEQWKNEYRTQKTKFEEAQRETERGLQPLYTSLSEVEESIKEQVNKINALKAGILKNDMNIENLLRMVVTPQR